jgi:prevent-host-death family protein
MTMGASIMAKVEISAGLFKSKCLKLMDDVNEKHISIIITKRGKAIAQLVPLEEKSMNFFGCMEGTVTINGDIVAPIDEQWEADE